MQNKNLESFVHVLFCQIFDDILPTCKLSVIAVYDSPKKEVR